MNKKYYEVHIEWIKNNKFRFNSKEELTEAFNSEFNFSLTPQKISGLCKRYKIPLKYKCFTWEKEIEWLKKNKKNYNDREDILNAMNKELGTSHNLLKIKDMNTKYKLNLPLANKRINAGLIKGRIKLRGKPELEIGEEACKSGKNIYIKTSNSGKKFSDNFTLKHRYLYEKYYNEKLKVDDIVLFLDGDYTNFSKENLYKLDKKIQRKMLGHNLYNTKTNRLCVIKILEWETKIKELENE